MTAKEYLEQAIRIDKRIAAVDNCIKEQVLRKNTLSAIDYSKETIQSSEISDVSDLVASIDEHIGRLQTEKDRLKFIKNDVATTINAVKNNVYATLLIRKYLLDEPWDSVGRAVDVSESTARKVIHGQALQEVQRILSVKSEIYQILPP